MKFTTTVKALMHVSISIFLLIAGCGGGGGGGGDGVADTYTGKTTPVTITKDNAQEIMEDAFNGGAAGIFFDSAFSAVVTNQSDSQRPSVYRHLSIIAKNIGRIAAANDSSDIPASFSALKTQAINETGECGGKITGTMQINDVTGALSGSLTFNEYCEMGSVTNGTVIFSGNFDLDTIDYGGGGNFNLTMTFTNFREVSSYEDYDVSMKGTITMASNEDSITMTMDVYMKDNSTGEYYWMEDLVFSSYDYYTREIMEVSGKFYSPDEGYVTLDTVTPLVVWYEDENPSEGVIIAYGAGNSKAKLTALSSTTYMVEADEDGDGTYEWNSGILYWEE